MTGLTCVLIEDSGIQARVISDMIVKAGWSCFAALDLNAGFDIIDKQCVDLVISDLMLPDSTDGGTIARIKARAPQAKIAAISAGGGGGTALDLLARARQDGAEFLLKKPFTHERLKAMLDEVATRLTTGTKRPHVLVVDDSRTMRAICQQALTSFGYRVTVMESMDEALAGIDILDLDAILTDVFMPGRSVLESIAELRIRLPGVAVIAMSGDGGEGSTDKALRKTLDAGADVAIAKPFTPLELASAVRKATVLAAAGLLEAVRQAG